MCVLGLAHIHHLGPVLRLWSVFWAFDIISTCDDTVIMKKTDWAKSKNQINTSDGTPNTRSENAVAQLNL